MTAQWIAEVCGGVLSGDPSAEITGGRADSRLCRTGDLFVALPGEHVDGSRFVAAAWEAGADAALAADSADVPEPPAGKALILVSDPLAALQKAASERIRLHPGLRVAGVTGSNGKTTTKEILAAIVRQHWGERALVTRGNYNSDIGLPLMILELKESHEAAVLEMGMNRRGEIAELVSIAPPDVAVITNIGTAHVGLMGSVEAIATEKREILGRGTSDSVAVIGDEEPWADFLLENWPGRIRRFGVIGRNGWDSVEDLGLDGFSIVRHGRRLSFALPGRHNLLNAMAAVEAALALGVGEEDVAAGLESVRAAAGRSEVRRGAVTIIRDGYNANPESLNAAFRLFEESVADGRKIMVLGEMLELGESTQEALTAAGGAAADIGPDALFLFGASLRSLKDAAEASGFAGVLEEYTDMDRLREALEAYLEPGDLVLLKGSRGNALERLDDVFERIGTG